MEQHSACLHSGTVNIMQHITADLHFGAKSEQPDHHLLEQPLAGRLNVSPLLCW
jgi:hypothetical protein